MTPLQQYPLTHFLKVADVAKQDESQGLIYNMSTQLRRWQPVIPLIDEFKSCLSSKVAPFQIEEASDRTWTEDEYKNRALQDFPVKLRGVYLLFNSVERLQYIGVAMWSFDTRVWGWDNILDFDRRYIDVISFADSHAQFALALEYFLICRLKPPFNKRFVDYDCP